MKKILIIDDYGPLLALLRFFIILEGHSVFVAQSGEKGLRLFDQVVPDLVLTDWNMPGMDGFEVLQRIVARAPATKVIIMTGMGYQIKKSAARLGAADFLLKPISRNCLSKSVKAALGGCEDQTRQ